MCAWQNVTEGLKQASNAARHRASTNKAEPPSYAYGGISGGPS